jgi:hypothetical protein
VVGRGKREGEEGEGDSVVREREEPRGTHQPDLSATI